MIEVDVSNRLWMRLDDVPKEAAKWLREQFEHNNPAYHKKRSMGYGVGSEVPVVKTWKHSHDDAGTTWLSLPRGGTGRFREMCDRFDLDYAFHDRMTLGDVSKCGGAYTGDWVTPQIFPDQKQIPWNHQDRIIEAMLAKKQGVVRAPTGSGKTSALIEAIRQINVPAIVIVWESGLLEQWQKRIEVELGITKKHQGLIQGKTCRLRPITLAMQQTLNKYTEEKWKKLQGVFGLVGADELQRYAADTFVSTIDEFDAAYRVGVSADECVMVGTFIAMGDGTNLPIEKVREGDMVVTPLGPRRVLKAMFKGLQKTVRVNGKYGHVRCTRDTWFATRDGWLNHESICYRPVYVRSMLPQGSGSDRCPQGQAVSKAGVEGFEIRGDVRSLEAAVACDESFEVTVDRDLLTVPTFDLSIEGAECFYANGFLVHNTRRDGKEFLIYDFFGQIICDIPKNELEGKGIIHEVQAEVIPTEFKADWYGDEPQPDFSALLRQMIDDDDRNETIVRVACDYYNQGETLLLFTHRIDHTHTLRRMLAAKGIEAEYMLGGVSNQKDFVHTVERMRDLKDPLRVAIGTLGKVGVGLDIPNLTVGIATTPIHNNRQFMNQVKGRICRRCSESGKTHAKLVYIWDREVFGRQPLLKLNQSNKEVFVQHNHQMIEIIEYLKDHYEESRTEDDGGIFASAESIR